MLQYIFLVMSEHFSVLISCSALKTLSGYSGIQKTSENNIAVYCSALLVHTHTHTCARIHTCMHAWTNTHTNHFINRNKSRQSLMIPYKISHGFGRIALYASFLNLLISGGVLVLIIKYYVAYYLQILEVTLHGVVINLQRVIE